MLAQLIALLPLLALCAQASPVRLRGRQIVLDPNDPALQSQVDSSTWASSSTSSTSSSVPSSTTDASPGITLTDSFVLPSSTGNPTPQLDAATAAADAGAVSLSTADLLVIKFAALAEALESNFYEVALQKFSPQAFRDFGFVDGQAVFDQLSVIQKDESTHHSILRSAAQSAGGSTADVDTCQFNFDAATRDVASFIATARVLEYVGVSAYIGGATLIESKGLLVSAAEILTVEARHNTLLNIFSGGSAVASPFDMALSPQQVLSLAAPFISGGCDPVAALGLTPTPALTITNTETLVSGTLLTFGGAIEGQDLNGLFCKMIVGGATVAQSFPLAECRVPQGIDGPVYLFIVRGPEPPFANIVGQQSDIIVAGPALVFIDTIANLQSQVLLGKSPALQQHIITQQHQTPAHQSSPPSHQPPAVHQTSGHYSDPVQHQPPPAHHQPAPPDHHQIPPAHNGQVKVITTTTVIEKLRQDHHIKTPVDGGAGGAVALGWL